MTTLPALLALADGSIFEGVAIGAEGDAVGELVFNTSMTGYQEMLTDPSYARQMILLTTAHVGNTGCNADDMESSKVWASGLVVRDAVTSNHHYRAERSLSDWLKKKQVVAIAGVDTRALTLKLRTFGAMNACITTAFNAPDEAVLKAQACQSLTGLDLAKMVSRQTIERWHEGRGEWAIESLPKRFHVVVYDFGVKQTILRILSDKGCHISLVPAQTTAEEVLSMNPDGVVLSNGPGDPAACGYAIQATEALLAANVPLLGICLGFQILGLACGARTSKMKFGHHGANHPVMDLSSKRVLITSQNHGFMVDEASLPTSLMVTHRSLFDESIQGMMHRDKRAFGFQGHPEASPGPQDAICLFDPFIEWMSRPNQSS